MQHRHRRARSFVHCFAGTLGPSYFPVVVAALAGAKPPAAVVVDVAAV